MRYFTSSLYELANSSDLDQTYAAIAEWDKHSEKYLSSLSKWIDGASSGVRKLAEKFHGHDSEIVVQLNFGASFVLVVQNEHEVWQLRYEITTRPITSAPQSAIIWSRAATSIWLYDELSLLSSGFYRHEILLDNGSVLQIDFRDVQLQPSRREGKYDLKIELPLTGAERKKRFPKTEIIPRPKAARAAFRQAPVTSGKRVLQLRPPQPKISHKQ